ncbi:hypothetical protein FXO38_18686 [Capsicum annuum]|nr:hypothetical protein FXO38_18686 [Capsicum annuum]
MLEIEHPNQEEVHVFVKGQMLRFSINEFALITGLNYFENIDDFKYEDSSTRSLMKRYFPQSTNGVDKEALVELFLKGNFENKEDALQMTILYFIHTFIYSQLNASSVLFSDLKMVEDGKYQFFLGCSYANIVPIVNKFEKLDLERTSFASDHHGTSSMPSSSKIKIRGVTE